MCRDVLDEFEKYDRELAAKEARLPHCEYCGQAIYETYFDINGEIMCEDCLRKNYEYDVETYMD
jgi:formylmethanofuran dehydrogenase subunit E